jgi:hypothetical protein
VNEPINLANPRTEWEAPIWTPEPLFRGETVFAVACGPSLTPEVAEKLKGQRVAVCNSACYVIPDADLLFFTDAGWFEAFNDKNEQNRRTANLCGRPGNDTWPRRTFLEAFPGLLVSFAPVAKRVLDDPSNPYPMARKPRVLRVKACGAPEYPPKVFPRGGPQIHNGRSSGHSLISLLVAMEAKRIALVGYDMRLVEGREHFHNDYTPNRDLQIYEREFVNLFKGWNVAALATGTEIVNCTPGSAITEFPSVELDAVINELHNDHFNSARSDAANNARSG